MYKEFELSSRPSRPAPSHSNFRTALHTHTHFQISGLHPHFRISKFQGLRSPPLSNFRSAPPPPLSKGTDAPDINVISMFFTCQVVGTLSLDYCNPPLKKNPGSGRRGERSFPLSWERSFHEERCDWLVSSPTGESDWRVCHTGPTGLNRPNRLCAEQDERPDWSVGQKQPTTPD